LSASARVAKHLRLISMDHPPKLVVLISFGRCYSGCTPS
jgi:hypothetical protein